MKSPKKTSTKRYYKWLYDMYTLSGMSKFQFSQTLHIAPSTITKAVNYCQVAK